MIPEALFEEYVGIKERDGRVAAAVVQGTTIRKLAPFVDGTPITRTLRGGSQQYCGILLNGAKAELGDYIIADRGGVFLAWSKEAFEKLYIRKTSSERR